MGADTPRRPLPDILSPMPAAYSPVSASRNRERHNSPFRSPTWSPSQSTASLTMDDVSMHSESRLNSYNAPTGPVTPLQIPQRGMNSVSAHTSPGSPVRRLQFQRETSSPKKSLLIDITALEDSTDLSASYIKEEGPFENETDVRTLNHENVVARDQFVEDKTSVALSRSATVSSYGSDISHMKLEKEGYVDEVMSITTLSTLHEQQDAIVFPPTESQPRRHKSTSRKQVRLVRGNLVLDCPVPSKLYSFLPRRDCDEFVYMRYSACTSDPDSFAENGFTIRPAIYNRDTELCVCITMYNEDEFMFTRTLHAVFKNIAHLCNRSRSKVWGPQGWKKIVVTIVSDGRSKINPRVLDCLAAMGVFQDGVAKNYVNGQEVQAHIFEYTAQVCLSSDMKFQGAEKKLVPVQMIFCLKERNAKKINSHRWLFNAFCPQLNPNIVVLLDVGTRPATQTLYHLWKAFDEDSNVAGACGEIEVMTGKMGRSLINPLVAAQNFEYKMSNILDKPFESAFGYISVLPGALSAYRFRALENNPDGTGPLHSYFLGEKLDVTNAGIFEKNMYLAEDRILCWELIAKKNEKWVLKYVRAAKGETDVPEGLAEFISQRRRWTNGAVFAAIYSLTHFRQIWNTAHSPMRKFFLHIEFLYQLCLLIFTFFGIANFYLATYFIAGSVSGDNEATIKHGGGTAFFLIIKYICIIAISAQFVLSLGNRPQGAKHMFLSCVVALAFVTLCVMIIGIYFVARTCIKADHSKGVNALLTVVVSLITTYGLNLVMSLVYLDPWHMFTSALQYFLLLPAYVTTVQTYAYCNTHDVTWGTKGDNEPRADLGSAIVRKGADCDIVEVEMPSEQIDIDTGYENALQYLRERMPLQKTTSSAETRQMDLVQGIRSQIVLIWLVANLLFVLLITQFITLDQPGSNVYLQIILWSTAAFAACKAVGSLVYLIQQLVRAIHKTHLHTCMKWKNYWTSKKEWPDKFNVPQKLNIKNGIKLSERLDIIDKATLKQTMGWKKTLDITDKFKRKLSLD